MPCRRISSLASDARASGRTVCTSVVMISATRMGCLRFHPSKAVLDDERRKRDTSEGCRFHAHVVRTFRSSHGRPEDLLLTAVGEPDGFRPPKINQGCEISRRCRRTTRRPKRSVSDPMWHPACAGDACTGAIVIAINNVLVAIDFGDTSQKVLAYGQNLTRAFGGRLHVLHVADVIATTASQFYPEHAGDPEMRAESLAM